MNGLRCLDCGCTIPPDSNKCPNCGNVFGEVRARPGNNGIASIKVGRAKYTIDCLTHGRIQINALVSIPPSRCPFCWHN